MSISICVEANFSNIYWCMKDVQKISDFLAAFIVKTCVSDVSILGEPLSLREIDKLTG